MKGYLHVGGAFVLGALIIAGALYMRSLQNAPEPGALTIASSSARDYIEPNDINGNGVSDWEKSLQQKALAQVSATSSNTADASSSNSYTAQFSRSFFENYLSAKTTGDLTQEDKQAFVDNAVSAIQESSKSKIYISSDITTIGSNDAGTLHNYGNTVADIMIKNAITKKQDEAVILQNALQQNQPELLGDLEPIKDVYKKAIDETLAVPVPNSMMNEHLDLLNAYQAMYDDLDAMERAFDDPLYTMARMKRYQDDSKGLYLSFVALDTKFKNANVTFGDNESGTLFQLFEQAQPQIPEQQPQP